MFNPKEFLTSGVLRPGVYSVRLKRWQTKLFPNETRFILEFEVKEAPEETITDWWSTANDLSIRRAIQVVKALSPEELDDTYSSKEAFLEKAVNLLKAGDWIKILVVNGTRADGSPVSRIRQYLGKEETKGEEVPF